METCREREGGVGAVGWGTFNHQCSCAAGWSKVVSGHTCVSATICLGDVGDTQSPILHDSLSEENDKTETAHLFFYQFFNWMKSNDKKIKWILLSCDMVSFLKLFEPPPPPKSIYFILTDGSRIYSKSLFSMPQKITIILAQAEEICCRLSIILTAQKLKCTY